MTQMTLQQISPVTHDTFHLVLSRPEGFDFEAGQAAELSLPIDGIRDEGRAFTMTSQPDAASVEFVIKSYPDHDGGVTKHLAELEPDDQIDVDGPFGAITDHGKGVFLAGGAGVTPFIALLKKHDREGVTGDQLIFSNKTDADIILKDTWEGLPGVTPTFIVTGQDDTAHRQGKLDKAALQELVADFDQTFYICGPGGFVDAMRDALTELGVSKDKLVIEDGW